MNRRESIRLIGLGSVSAGVIISGCKEEKLAEEVKAGGVEVPETGREAFEIERDRKLLGEKFFDEHEMATITVLVDIIIPKDEVSGCATDAKVPEFIEFIVKDIPEHQVPLRGGLRWLDTVCLERFDKAFIDCSQQQQLEVVDEIAYPDKAKPGMEQGVAFFNRMRDLTATGFYTTEIGLKDLEYKGNSPVAIFEGPPMEEIEKYGLKEFI
jgi:hypothetical protein